MRSSGALAHRPVAARRRRSATTPEAGPSPRPAGTGELHQGRGADPGAELHRLPQPEEVGEQVRDDDLRPARQGGPAGRGDHARAGRARREPVRRADPARRRAADAVQAGPAAAREDRAHRALGEGGGEVRRRRARPRTGPPSSARHTPVVDPRGLSRDRADHGAGVQPRRHARSRPRAITRSTLWKAADGALDRRLRGPGRAGLRHRLQPRRQVDGDRQRRPRPVRRRSSSGSPSPAAAASRSATSLETHRQRLRRRLQPRQQARSPPPGADRAIRVWEVETGQARWP